MDNNQLKLKAGEIRRTIVKAIHNAGSGHPGGSLSEADILTVLYFHVMNVDPRDPKKVDRDKFVLSKGHGAPGLYATLGHRGFFPVENIMSLRKIGGDFQGHPDMARVPGVEMSTGSLGQGLSVSVGMALANRLDGLKSRVYTLLGDGELQEGMVWEAAMAAGHYKLSNLTAIVDWNGLQIDGKNQDVMNVEPIGDKFASFGWTVLRVNGHDVSALKNIFEKADANEEGPILILAETIKGKGVSFMEDSVGWHGKSTNEEEYALAMKELGGEI